MTQDDEYLTVDQLAQRYRAFSQGSIRWLLFKRESNGFNRCVRKIGRKVFISAKDFQAWLEEQQHLD